MGGVGTLDWLVIVEGKRRGHAVVEEKGVGQFRMVRHKLWDLGNGRDNGAGLWLAVIEE